MQKIRPCLWFDGTAEEAVNYYLTVFQGNITHTYLCGESGPGPKGSVLALDFELEGQAFMALNGGPMYQLTPAISLFVGCADQREVDTYWDKLAADGGMQQCGWVTDKFGVTWQIVPPGLNDYLFGNDGKKSQQAMEAMLQMQKLDIGRIKNAYDR